MKFRVSIAGIMTVVVLIALNCAVIRTLVHIRLGPPRDGLLLISVLPMANALFAVLIRVRAGIRRGAPRPFLIGFAAAGSAALGLYVALIMAFPHTVAHALDDSLTILDPLTRRGIAGIVAVVVLALAWNQLPILAPALMGGWFYRRRAAGAERSGDLGVPASDTGAPLRSAPATLPPRPLGIGAPDPITTRLVDPAGSR